MTPAIETFPYEVPRAGVNVRGLLAAVPESTVPIARTDEFIDVLRSAGRGLVAANMQDVFNYVYWHLTTEVLHTINQDNNSLDYQYPVFEMNDKVEQMTGIFGDLYLRQLRHYGEWVEGDDEAINRMNAPWLYALFHPAMAAGRADGPKFLAGMKAHIQADLFMAVEKGGIDEDYHADYSGPIQTLIQKVTHELAPALVPVPGPNQLRRMKMFVGPIVGYIGTIREVAWDNALQLAEAKATDAETRLWAVENDLPYHESDSDEAFLVQDVHNRARRSIDTMLTVASGPMEIGSRLVRQATSLAHSSGASWRTYGQAV